MTLQKRKKSRFLDFEKRKKTYSRTMVVLVLFIANKNVNISNTIN